MSPAMTPAAEQWLAGVRIDRAVRDAHPDYAAAVFIAAGLEPGPPTAHSEALLAEAEAFAAEALAGRDPGDLPEIAAWRQAYLSFGVKPREARSSVESLLRRAATGLPRIDRLTDVYNAISVLHLMPVGGEDVGAYSGPARLVVAAGDEPFDTVAHGEPVTESPIAGEVVWRDDAGVTCRRWNWRQCVRTRLGDAATEALFIVDGLGPDARERADAAAADLAARLAVDSPSATFTFRTIAD